MNLLEPWIFLRMIAGLVGVVFFARAAITSAKVLRHFDVARASEGQLALERQVELASTFVRVATVTQVASLALTVLAADRLSHGVRGAMCAYGVFHADPWGFPALALTGGVALVAGVLAQVYAFDARLPRLELVRPLAFLTLAAAPLAIADFVVTGRFLLKLDLSVVASCCSVELDGAAAGAARYAEGPRELASIVAPLAIAVSIAVALFAARRPRAPLVALAGAVSIAALPPVLAAAVLEVAPYAFELPQHVCPFCLLRGDALGIGYPLFGGIFLAVVWGAGAAASALLSRRVGARDVFEGFARGRLRREACAWAVVLAVGVAPIVRYAIVSGGASLFR